MKRLSKPYCTTAVIILELVTDDSNVLLNSSRTNFLEAAGCLGVVTCGERVLSPAEVPAGLDVVNLPSLGGGGGGIGGERFDVKRLPLTLAIYSESSLLPCWDMGAYTHIYGPVRKKSNSNRKKDFS